MPMYVPRVITCYSCWNQAKVPSVANIIQITAAAAAQIAATVTIETAHIAAAQSASAVFAAACAQKISSPLEKDAAIQLAEKQPAVVVGITPTVPLWPVILLERRVRSAETLERSQTRQAGSECGRFNGVRLSETRRIAGH